MHSAFLALLLLAACGARAGANSVAEKACADTADAIAKAAERCGEAYQTNYDAFVQEAVGSCSRVVKVQDEGSLRSTCFSYLRSVACADFRDGKLDPSCQGQLLTTAGAPPDAGDK